MYHCLLQGLINDERGVFYNTLTHEEVPITQALNQGLIVGQLVSATDKELFRSALVASRISTDTALVSVLNPITGAPPPTPPLVFVSMTTALLSAALRVRNHRLRLSTD